MIITLKQDKYLNWDKVLIADILDAGIALLQTDHGEVFLRGNAEVEALSIVLRRATGNEGD